MMTYTRSAIGLLTRQYRSVLKKCFLINMGLFALGAVSAANAAVSLPTPTLDVKHAADPTTYPNGSAYQFITDGSGDTNYDVKVTDGTDSVYGIIALKNTSTIGWSAPLDTDPYPGQTDKWTDNNASSNVTVDTTLGTVTGAIRMKMSHNGVVSTDWNRYFTYAYTKASTFSFIANNSSIVATSSGGGLNIIVPTDGRNDNVVTNAVDATISTGNDKITNKTYTNNALMANFSHGGNFIGGSVILNQGTIGDVVVDFIGNRTTMTQTSSSIYNLITTGAMANVSVTDNKTASISSIVGDFIGNSSDGNGGAISNYNRHNNIDNSVVSIGSIVGNFIGNSAGAGGAIYNYNSNGSTSSIGTIKGDFIGNSGAAIYNFGSSSTSIAEIGSITGDFIGNHLIKNERIGGGAIRNDYMSWIGSITGNFIGNFVSSTYSEGGAIYNQKEINSIVGNFIGNAVSASSGKSYGGAIDNFSNGKSATIGSIVGNFIGNSATSTSTASYGGAIYNEAYNIGSTNIASIGSIVGDFIGNYAKVGGAIFNGNTATGGLTYTSNARITLAGNTFTGNYLLNGTPNSIYNGGIITIANGATVTINDGWKSHPSAQLITELGSTLNMNVANGVLQNDNVTSDSGNNLGKLTKNGAINATVDVNLELEKADTISTMSVTLTDGIKDVTLNSLKFLDDDPLVYKDVTKTVQILKTQAEGLELVLCDNLKNGILQQGEKVAHSDEFGGTAKWTDTYGSYNLSTDLLGTVTLAQTTTANDSITIKITGTQETKSDITSDGDTLKIVNQSTMATRNFNATADGEIYVVSDDTGLGKAGAGIININGKPDGAEENGTIDLNSKTGFELDKATTLNLNNVKLTNATGDIIDAGAAAVVNLNNAEIDGSMTNAGVINSNNAVLGGNVIGMGDSATLNITGDTEMAGIVTNHKINVSNAKLTVGAGNLVASDSLTAKDGSEIDVDSNKVNLDQVSFESGSKLSLKINSLEDFGGIEANNITVAASGAELSATLAQGINAGTVQLLKANNTDFNNFADSFDNEMYVFEKVDKNGLYNIKLAKTAEEVAEEAGASSTVAHAAAAWVDGDQFAEGSTAAKVADALADLAQNNPQEFKNSLAAIVPVDAPESQVAATNMADKLLLTVGKYLSNQDIGGLTSGDTLQDVTLWAKGYYGKSKLSNYGKIKGFDSTNKGIVAGLDKKLNKSVKLGGGFQYDANDVDGYRRDIDVNTLTGFVYGEYRPNNWFVSGVASYGKSDYDEEKYALGIRIKDKYSVDIYSLQALTGYEFKYVTPEAGARYYRIKRHGYEDNIGQSVSGKDMDLLRGVLGLRTSYEFGMFKPEVYAGITYDFVSDKDNAIVSLPNGSSYMVDGKRLNRFGTEFSANVTARLNDNASVSLGYDGKFRKHYQDHSGMINVKYEF